MNRFYNFKASLQNVINNLSLSRNHLLKRLPNTKSNSLNSNPKQEFQN